MSIVAICNIFVAPNINFNSVKTLELLKIGEIGNPK